MLKQFIAQKLYKRPPTYDSISINYWTYEVETGLGTASYELENASSCTITEVKHR